MSSSKIRPTNSCLEGFKDYVIQKRWVSIALLIASLVVLSLAIGGGLDFFKFQMISQAGSLTAFIGGGVAATIGVLVSIVLLVKKGRSPLHRAVKNKDSIEQLLDPKNINKPDHSGNRPLHYAVLYEHALDTLLAEGAIDVNARNNSGHTPLQVAIKAGKKEAVEALLAHPRIVIGAAMIKWAIRNGKEELVLLLLESEKIEGISWKEPLFEAIEKGQIDYVKAILAKYETTDHPDLEEALVLAASRCRRNSEIFDAILATGVNVNAKGNEEEFVGRTALHIAAYQNNIKLVCKLLAVEGIDVNQEDTYGRTPLALAMVWPWIEVAKAIIESGKVSEENLKKAEIVAEKTTSESEYGTDCSAVTRAIAEARASAT